MDEGTLGAIATVLVALAFAGVCWWAFAPRRKRRFEEDAKLPFADEPDAEPQQDEQNDRKRSERDDRAGRN